MNFNEPPDYGQLTESQKNHVVSTWGLLQSYVPNVPNVTREALSHSAWVLSNGLLSMSQTVKFNSGLVSKSFYETGKCLSKATPEHFHSRKNVMMKLLESEFNTLWTAEEFYNHVKHKILWHGVVSRENRALMEFDMCMDWETKYEKAGIELVEWVTQRSVDS